jgi:hypothetical protein
MNGAIRAVHSSEEDNQANEGRKLKNRNGKWGANP